MTRGLLRSTSLVSVFTLMSRVLGLVRDVVIARFFGAGLGMDVFIIAFQIPNFLRRLFAEGAFSQAFVPVASEYHKQRPSAELKALADRVAGTLGMVLLVLTVLGALLSPLLIWIFSPGFAGEAGKFDLAVSLLRITFPYLLFISLTAMAGGLLNTLGRFGVPAFTPVLLNVCLILAAVVWAPHFAQPVTALAWGVFIAGAAQLAFQLPFLARVGLLPRPRWGWSDPGVQKIITLMLPVIFGASVAQINLIVDRNIASWLNTGSISWLYYSDRLMEFPLGVFSIALATVILPGLSGKHSAGDTRAFSDTLDWALRLAVIIVLPAAVGLLTLAAPTLATLFQYGEFDATDTRMASYSLMAYTVGLLGFSLVKVLLPGYFARQDTRTPVRIGVIALLANIVLNLALVLSLRASGFVAPHLGLALATGLSACLNAALLYRGLRRNGVYAPLRGWGALLVRVGAGCGVMTVLIYQTGFIGADWSDLTASARAGRLALAISGGAAAYFVTLLALGLRPRHLHGDSAGAAV